MTLNYKHLTWHVLWIIPLFEATACALVACNSNPAELTKPLFAGLIVGYIGLLIVLSLLNLLFHHCQKLLHEQRIIKLKNILLFSLYGSIYLFLIFLIQTIFLTETSFLGRAMAGFISVGGATFILLLLHNFVQRFHTCFTLKILTISQTWSIRKVDLIIPSLMLGLYEAAALPVIESWRLMSSHPLLSGFLFGLAGGLLGVVVVLLIFNFVIGKFFSMPLFLEKSL